MAILSSTIRRSHVLRRLLLNNNNGPIISRQNNPTALFVARRGIHATSAVNGDALDMADTFSRRHGKLYKIIIYCCAVRNDTILCDQHKKEARDEIL